MREALPRMPSRRSGRRRKRSCLKRLTARTWGDSVGGGLMGRVGVKIGVAPESFRYTEAQW